LVSRDGNKGTFVEINDETSGGGEVIKDLFEVRNMLGDSPDDDKGVIRVLKGGARKIIDEGVQEKAVAGGLEDHLLQDINDDIEQERGEGVALPEATAALNPSAGDPVEQDRSLTSAVKHFNPISPERGEALGFKNPIKSIPTNGVECLAEVQLEHGGRGIAPVTSLDNVGSVDKVFSYGATGDEPSLVRVDEVGDEIPKAKGKAFGVDLKATVLEGNRAEVIRSIRTLFLRRQHNVRFVDGSEVSFEGVEVLEGRVQAVFDHVPVVLVEGRTKAVRARARIILHGEKGGFYFLHGERGNKGSSLGWGEGGGGNPGSELGDGVSGKRGAKEAFEEGVQDGGFGMVGENRVAAVIIQVFNLVLLQPARGTEMEIARVFVAKKAVLYFGPLPPIRSPIRVFVTKIDLDKRTET
jgi:hypothetical protein